MDAITESRYSKAIGEFASEFNERAVGKPLSSRSEGQRWVRIRPPDEEDFKMVREDPRTMPFTRVGSECIVTDVGFFFVGYDRRTCILTIQVGKNSLMVASDYFLSTFVRIVDGAEWHSLQRQT
jgi:hypothetical protein